MEQLLACHVTTCFMLSRSVFEKSQRTASHEANMLSMVTKHHDAAHPKAFGDWLTKTSTSHCANNDTQSCIHFLRGGGERVAL